MGGCQNYGPFFGVLIIIRQLDNFDNHPYVPSPTPWEVNDPSQGLWSSYHTETIIRYGIWPQFDGSFGPQGKRPTQTLEQIQKVDPP